MMHHRGLLRITLLVFRIRVKSQGDQLMEARLGFHPKPRQGALPLGSPLRASP